MTESVLVGDFNLPGVDWSIPACATESSSVRLLKELASLLRGNQCNGVKNNRLVLLDLVFSSIPDTVVHEDCHPLVNIDPQHPALNVRVPVPQLNYSSASLVPDFRRCDMASIFLDLQSLGFCEMDYLKSTDELFSAFGESVRDTILAHTPMKKIGTSKNYIAVTEDRLKNNPKVFWGFIGNVNNSPAAPSIMRFADLTTTEPALMSSYFAQFFSSSFSRSNSNQSNLVLPVSVDSEDLMADCDVTFEEVEKALVNLDVYKGCGPGMIPPRVLRYCSPVLTGPIHKLFGKSLQSGVFPEALKQSYIVPIHKGGAIDNVSAWFFYGRSTVTNLVVLQDYIVEAFKKTEQVDALYLDFSKAFDKVSHPLLIRKLEASGITGTLLKWFASYLSDCQLSVRFASSVSEPFAAVSGVPQGSHLGPKLCNIFISDIVYNLEANTLLFADDIKIFKAIQHPDDCKVLQDDLTAIEGWWVQNDMALNSKKCLAFTFHRIKSPIHFNDSVDGDVMRRPPSVCDLGVVWTPALNADAHIAKKCLQATRALGFLMRSAKPFSDPGTLRTLYCSMVRPIVEYASVVWSPHQSILINDLERIQTKFLRYLGVRTGFLYREVPVDHLAEALCLPQLAARRKVQDLMFLYKIINSLIDCPELLERILGKYLIGGAFKGPQYHMLSVVL
ncbi:uncharacterized protein LOC124373466 [Homalodisca vitripennis]|uniref:uncharacterized protein LOC124373466 n=1 Tax=Homalodisca vitripennis TaxID=197043 RepID=UPI001EEB1E72|nr:uncharacterized protein LOC124373466 [Homalodisca vitripennis]